MTSLVPVCHRARRSCTRWLLILAAQHESTQPVRYVVAGVLGTYGSRSRGYGVLGTLAYPRLINYRIRRRPPISALWGSLVLSYTAVNFGKACLGCMHEKLIEPKKSTCHKQNSIFGPSSAHSQSNQLATDTRYRLGRQRCMPAARPPPQAACDPPGLGSRRRARAYVSHAKRAQQKSGYHILPPSPQLL